MPFRRRRLALTITAAAACLLLASTALPGRTGGASGDEAHAATAPLPAAPAYVPGEVLVNYRAHAGRYIARGIDRRLGAQADSASSPAPDEQLVHLPRGLSVPEGIAMLRREPGVASAVPNYIAHQAGAFYPNDPGRTGHSHGWEQLQWNFLAASGVNAPEAWANLRARHRPGARGVVVAVLDTGIAYRKWHRFRESPDFAGTRFVHPYDFVAKNRYPLDREGHGTFVAGVIAEATNNRLGLTGLAYGASIMPVRILGADGTGDAATISRGIRYAARHGAQVINLSLEFPLDIGANDIPNIISALRFARSRGVIVVASAGNEGAQEVAYPARAQIAISVGATTIDRCLANYSNNGSRLDLVAPGGDDDMVLPSDPDCNPERSLPDIFQMTFFDPSNPRHFGFPGGYFGTSMSSPHVAAAAAMVIASRVIGRHPTPDRVLARLEATARPLGGSKPNPQYGYGLLDIGAATS